MEIGARAGLGDLSYSSLTRRLTAAGMFLKIAAVKDILTQEHQAARLYFAHQYVNVPLEFWRWVVFTDEKT